MNCAFITLYERDNESGLDFAQARYHNYNHGRFTSPDPLQGSAQASDPQTWNRYSYALNNPLKYIDPTGEKAKVVIETDEKNKTGTITITASIALWTSNKTSVTQGQLDQAAKNMEAAIEKGWSGTFVKDGITYTVKTDVDVQGYFGHDQEAAMKSGLDNVIEMTDGPPDGGPSHVERRGVLSSESAPDTGRWNVLGAKLINIVKPVVNKLPIIEEIEEGGVKQPKVLQEMISQVEFIRCGKFTLQGNYEYEKDKSMNYETFKDYSKWLSQISAAISLIAVVFLRSKAVFIDEFVPGTLLLIAMITAALTFIFSVIALPRWQSFVSLAIFCYVTYFLFFTPLFGIH